MRILTILLLTALTVTASHTTRPNHPPVVPTSSFSFQIVAESLITIMESVEAFDMKYGYAAGISMVPVIGDGTQFLYYKPDIILVEPGQIILYSDDDNWIIHQAVLVLEEGILAKGINNEMIDPVLITEENFKGIVLIMAYGQPAEQQELFWLNNRLGEDYER